MGGSAEASIRSRKRVCGASLYFLNTKYRSKIIILFLKPYFCLQVNAEVCAQFAMKLFVTVECHPPPSVLDEATRQTIRTHLLQLINDHRTDWDRYLDEAAYTIRTLPQADTMITPYFLMFGRHPRAKVEVCVEQISDICS